ncbi:flagellar filament capping protein FliD [Lysobacter sp. A3-1-A15]|uniref:flagellar filament capping protein FliD n=1 Tax=Novilysobacter viscosus TaxID=3098602 RepID=UPI002ED8469E
MSAIGSSLDVNSIVRQLVAAERAPTDARNDRTNRQLQAQISALGSLRSAFAGLRTSAEALSGNAARNARSVTVEKDAGFTASATAGAALGQYRVEVETLATAHKLASAGFADSQATVGTGTLTLGFGGTTLQVEIDAASSSLSAIRDAINVAAGGDGILATIIQSDAGDHLVLSAASTGTANAITVSASGGDGGLSALTFDGATGGMQQQAAAGDAVVRIDGLTRTLSENSVADLVPGVSVELTRAQPGTEFTLGVASDPSAQRNAAKTFVNAYNGAHGAIASATAYNTSTQVAAALNGDAMVRGASRDLRAHLSSNVVELKAVGITVEKDGKLKIDEAAFNKAIAEDPAAVAALFDEDTGIGAGIGRTLATLLDDDGLMDSRSDSLDTRTKALASQRLALDRRMEQVEARYRTQFVALDGLVAQLQSTSNYLAQQLANLPGF